METRCCILGDVIPIAQGVLREWSEIKNFFGDLVNVNECLNDLTAHFLARLRRNAFDVMLTAFALTIRGRAYIHSAEYGFQTRGGLSELPELSFVSTMQHEFARAMAAQQGQPFDFDDQELARQEDPLMVNDDDWIRHGHAPFDPDEDSFRVVLQEELTKPLDDRLRRNLADGILVGIRKPIARQCVHLNYNPEQIFHLFDAWWTDADKIISADVHPDSDWRKFHGRSDERASLADVALRFITLGSSEADIECLLSRQKQIQQQFGTNCRTDTLQARHLLHQPR
jgi:hypothetical protein